MSTDSVRSDLAKHAEETWINVIADKDLLTRECLRRELDRRRQELAGPNPTPLEQQLVNLVRGHSLPPVFLSHQSF